LTTHLPYQSSITDHYSGELHEAPVMAFGRAGELSPKNWRLTVTKTLLPGSEVASVQYDLVIQAELPGSNFSEVTGNFGFPQVGVMSDYSYGYGTAGEISAIPQEILSIIMTQSGLKEFQEIQTIPYQYGYCFMGISDVPEEWFPSFAAAKDALSKDASCQTDPYFVRRELTPLERL
jgi:hypothetical protein